MAITYYLTDADGMITRSGNWLFDEHCLETDKAIIMYDGRLYFADDMPDTSSVDIKIEIAEQEAYLAATDYVTNKIVESGLSLADFLAAAGNEKYADVLIKREAAREKIAELR